MGLDGFSMRNLAINNDLPSSQLARESEISAQRSLAKGKDVSGLSEKQKIDPDEQKKKNQQDFEDGMQEDETNDNENDNEDLSEDVQSESTEEIKEQLAKNYSKSFHDIEDELANGDTKYRIKVDNKNDLVELIEFETGNIIEKIKPEELFYVVNKLNSAAGIIVNKKV